MRPREILHVYRAWFRARRTREAMAMIGVAIGVALVFATLTANLSIAGSANRIVHSLTGSAGLQATARTADGVPSRTLVLPGVAAVANALEVPVTISNGRRYASTQIIGAGASMVALNPTIANVPPGEGLILPSSLASSLHVKKGATVTINARGRAVTRTVSDVLGRETIGPLADSHLAFGPLGYVQHLVGLEDRVSTLIVKAQPGRLQLAERELKRAVEPAMEVTNTTTDAGLLAQALKPQDQSTRFFALLGGLVGILLIVTTTMLTLADRRLELERLQRLGFAPKALVQIVVSHGVILGGIGSLLGVAAGWWLAVNVFRSNPEYLASAFPLGTSTLVSIPLVAEVWFGGVLATCVCVGCALRRARSPVFRLETQLQHRLLVVVGVLLAASLGLVTIIPLLAALLLAVALFASVPVWVDAATRTASRLGGRFWWIMRAAGTIRGSQIRSIGLAATAAVGVFGATVAFGSHRDLLRGLETGYAHYVDSAAIWVASPGDSLATNSFPAAGLPARIRTVRGVAATRAYYGGWVDMAGRRVWLIARSTPHLLPADETVQKDTSAERRLRSGGWIAVSDQLARTLGAQVGSPITVPTPAGPQTFRLAATTTNLGWSSGVLFMASNDYVHDWPRATPTAIEVDGKPSLAAVRTVAGPGLTVQTSSQRAAVADVLPRQGLQRLSQIAWLLIVSATFAVALALSASLWQRRSELASQRLQSFTPSQLQRVLACEAVLIVGSGAILGAAAGIYGHFAADRYLHDSTGYPIVWTLGVLPVAGIVLLVAVATILILAIPGRIAARSPLRLAFDGR